MDGCRLGMAHLRIIANKPMKYLQSGDHLIIWPQNNDLSIVHSDTLPMDIPIQISRGIVRTNFFFSFRKPCSFFKTPALSDDSETDPDRMVGDS